MKKNLELVLAVQAEVHEKIAIRPLREGARALEVYTQNAQNVAYFRVQEVPTDIINVARGPWDKIVCQIPMWYDFQHWAVACKNILAPDGKIIVNLDWTDCTDWRLLAWRYARMSWKYGLKLETVNGCNATVNRLMEFRLNNQDRMHISERFCSLANTLSRVDPGGYDTLVKELCDASHASFRQGEQAAPELGPGDDKLFGVFSHCPPQEWNTPQMIAEAEGGTDDENDDEDDEGCVFMNWERGMGSV